MPTMGLAPGPVRQLRARDEDQRRPRIDDAIAPAPTTGSKAGYLSLYASAPSTISFGNHEDHDCHAVPRAGGNAGIADGHFQVRENFINCGASARKKILITDGGRR